MIRLMILAATLVAGAHDLATVDGTPVTVEELQQTAKAMGPKAEMMLANPKARRDLLEHIIDNRLMAREATKQGFDQSPGFAAEMAAAKAQILSRMLIERARTAATTDEALKALFAKDPKRFSKKELHAHHIIIDDEVTARRALQEAQAPGADFEALAKKYATGPETAKGGDMGWFARGRMVPQVEAAAFATPVGTVHKDLVKSQFGWHVLKVDAERGTDDVAFETVKADVRDEAERNARDELVQHLRAQAKVSVDEPKVQSLTF